MSSEQQQQQQSWIDKSVDSIATKRLKIWVTNVIRKNNLQLSNIGAFIKTAQFTNATKNRFLYGLSLLYPNQSWREYKTPIVKNSYRNIPKPTFDAIREMIWYFITTNQTNKYKHNARLAVLLTLITNLRSSELKQLTNEHINLIKSNKLVPIRIKKRLKSIKIIPIPMFLQIYDSISKPTDGFILTCSIKKINEILRLKFHEISNDKLVHVGITAIRAFNTTILLEHLDPLQVAHFNRHVNPQTTLQYYNSAINIGSKLNDVFRK